MEDDKIKSTDREKRDASKRKVVIVTLLQRTHAGTSISLTTWTEWNYTDIRSDIECVVSAFSQESLSVASTYAGDVPPMRACSKVLIYVPCTFKQFSTDTSM